MHHNHPTVLRSLLSVMSKDNIINKGHPACLAAQLQPQHNFLKPWLVHVYKLIMTYNLAKPTHYVQQ